jgi:hypothetical protein
MPPSALPRLWIHARGIHASGRPHCAVARGLRRRRFWQTRHLMALVLSGLLLSLGAGLGKVAQSRVRAARRPPRGAADPGRHRARYHPTTRDAADCPVRKPRPALYQGRQGRAWYAEPTRYRAVAHSCARLGDEGGGTRRRHSHAGGQRADGALSLGPLGDAAMAAFSGMLTPRAPRRTIPAHQAVPSAPARVIAPVGHLHWRDQGGADPCRAGGGARRRGRRHTQIMPWGGSQRRAPGQQGTTTFSQCWRCLALRASRDTCP